ncbi:SRPBCC family protein [Brachybacterium sacelli]|uniref:Uncharacterized protein YndB with AHSA1/START domain n=1 Tax=Brachybacterium sacelli TaxID=173364 RepID=A0ABS4WXB0_9MICO|nr:SRPBCC family protein [Brachybacterium sacelli]MBP2380850.1 uncharacterized protein YndB with AHSA1/START domain [Brachybacterium sacelli]
MTTPDPTLTQDGGRGAVVVERHFPHPVERVWQAVTQPEHLAHWFPGSPEFELHAGGSVRFPDFAGRPAESGTVLECEIPHRLRFSWDTDELLLELSGDADGTRLVLTHAFDDIAGAASFATGWEACLVGLTAVIAQEDVPDPGPRRERHEELARRFRLGRPTVTTAAEGWSARFERQLVCSAGTAWELFLGGAAEPDIVHPVPAIGEQLRAPQAPEVVLGTVTEVQAPTLLAFDTGPGEPGDHVRLELVEGTGHGARLLLTVRGADPAQKEAALEQWGLGAVDAIAEAALEASVGA